MSSRILLPVSAEKENVNPNDEKPANDSSSPSSKPPNRSERSAAATTVDIPSNTSLTSLTSSNASTSSSTAQSTATSSSSTEEPVDGKKKRKKASNAPRILTKEELADYIARDEFWQKTEPAEGEGDHTFGRGDEWDSENPIYEDCNEIRRKIGTFLRSGRMTQTAWCKLLDVNSGSFQRFMKAKGPYGGSGNCTYRFAAHFFESLRILEHRPKSAKRKREEEALGRYGRTTQRMKTTVRCLSNQIPVLDDMGRLSVIPDTYTAALDTVV